MKINFLKLYPIDIPNKFEKHSWPFELVIHCTVTSNSFLCTFVIFKFLCI